jgi:hypothetical protein
MLTAVVAGEAKEEEGVAAAEAAGALVVGGAGTALQSSPLARARQQPAPLSSVPLEPAPRPPALIPNTAAQTAAHHRGAAALPMSRPRPAQLAPALRARQTIAESGLA